MLLFLNKMYLEIKIWNMPWATYGSHRGERVKRKYAEITKSKRSAEWEAIVFKHDGSLHYSFLVFFLTRDATVTVNHRFTVPIGNRSTGHRFIGHRSEPVTGLNRSSFYRSPFHRSPFHRSPFHRSPFHRSPVWTGHRSPVTVFTVPSIWTGNRC